MRLSQLLVLFTSLLLVRSEPCKPSGVTCVDSLHYRICVNINGNGMPTGKEMACPTGNICDDDASFPCVAGTPPPTTTTPAPITAPDCHDGSKYPAQSCEQYYECVSAWWFWWEPKLRTCPEGQTFDPSTQECFVSGLVNCQPATTVTTTTTTSAPVTEPACSGSGKYPAPWCEQYYECESAWWWWEPHLKNCSQGLTFDPVTSECINSGLVNCQPTTTLTSTTTTTTNPPPVTEPACSGSSKYPAASCKQYYECVSVWWWWEPRLKTCPDGQTFNPSTGECYNSGLVDCKPTTTTTSTTTTTTTTGSTTSTTTTTVAPEPACSGAGKYPAPWCEQYYECESVMWWWEPRLKNCTDGLTFDSETSECVDSGLINCQLPTTTTTPPTTITTTLPPPVTPPTCTEAGKYPAPAKNQYYECKYAWLGWRQYLVTCPAGQIFEEDLQSCYAENPLPPCTEAGKYPGPTPNQYYECKYAWLKWKWYLVTCPEGQIFQESSKECALVTE